MKERVDHIRRPALPWRDNQGLTECGLEAEKVVSISRTEYGRRLKDLGRQRCALLTCMTCADTATRWASWEDDPRKAIGREVEWEVGRWGREDRRGQQLKDELIAIAALINSHRDEFDTMLQQIADRRAWVEKKAAIKAKPAPPPIRGGL